MDAICVQTSLDFKPWMFDWKNQVSSDIKECNYAYDTGINLSRTNNSIYQGSSCVYNAGCLFFSRLPVGKHDGDKFHVRKLYS